MDIARLKELLAIKIEEEDIILQYILNETEEIIKNYCNIKQIPEELKNTAYRMAMDLYQYGNSGSNELPVYVSSVSVGDTSTSFATTIDRIKDTLLTNYSEQLNRYRKLVW